MSYKLKLYTFLRTHKHTHTHTQARSTLLAQIQVLYVMVHTYHLAKTRHSKSIHKALKPNVYFSCPLWSQRAELLLHQFRQDSLAVCVCVCGGGGGGGVIVTHTSNFKGNKLASTSIYPHRSQCRQCTPVVQWLYVHIRLSLHL